MNQLFENNLRFKICLGDQVRQGAREGGAVPAPHGPGQPGRAGQPGQQDQQGAAGLAASRALAAVS